VCVAVGAIVLLSYYGVIPGRFTKWWPMLIVGVGVLMLIQHYWRELRRRSRVAEVVPAGVPPSLVPRTAPKLAPPIFPVALIAVGVYLQLRNLHAINLGVVLAIVLILVGVLFLSGGLRSSLSRS
jgi:hypothetical protein